MRKFKSGNEKPNGEIGVCSDCGEARVKGAECINGCSGKVWSLV